MESTYTIDEKDKVFKNLKKLINDYLAASPMKAIGPAQIYMKSFLLIAAWILSYSLLLTVGTTHPFAGLVCFIVLLVLTCGLEFCIMHDASHKAYSSYHSINKIALNCTLWVLGGCPLSWHQEHVVRHHGFTNILGSDPDVYASHVIRLHPSDKWYWWQRWQHFYAVPLYSFMWLHWFYNDFVNAIFNTYHLSKKKLCIFWLQIFFGLVVHLSLGLILPYLAFNNFWIVGIGYLIFFMTLSFAMAITFVLAHVSNVQNYFLTKEEVQKDWALHQLETTMDFAVNNRFLTWLLGGLNFQVEHHIFPAISHLHYPAIQKIVKKYCQENGIVYHEQKTLFGAILYHLAHLKTLSKPACSSPAFEKNELEGRLI